jgi:GT2 family glycosyltransferase
MDLSIIIVTYNSEDVIGKCLSSLKEHSPSCEHEIIVIDNASTDGTSDLVSNEFKSMRLEVNSENKGYSRGVNQGISLSRGRMFLIINPDIIVGEKSIDRLFNFMEDNPDAGMVGSKLIGSDGSLQYSCRSFYTLRALFLRRTFFGKLFPRAKALRKHLLMDYDHQKTRSVDWILGACMMVRVEAIEKTGLMDERFFLYFEDVDWCYRMKQHGWNVYYIPQSVMTHSYMRSSVGSIFHKPFLIHLLSLMRYYEKWNSVSYFFKRHRPVLKSLVFVFIDFLAINASFVLAYLLRGLTDPFFANGLYPISWYSYFIPFYNLIFFFSFLFGRLYRIHRETDAVEEFGKITRVTLVGLAVLMTSTYLLRIRIYSRAVILGQGAISIFLVFALRRLIRVVHQFFVKAGFDHKRVCLVANREETKSFLNSISSFPELGIDIVGTISNEKNSLGTFGNIGNIINIFKIQEIFIFPSFQSVEKIFPVIVGPEYRTVQIRIVSTLARFFTNGVRVDRMGRNYLFSVEKGSVVQLKKWVIRIMDILFSFILMPFSIAFSLFLRLYGKVFGHISFYREKRYAGYKREILWPRIEFESGREGSDIFKPELYFLILINRLSFVGLPALPSKKDLIRFTGTEIVSKPGITGRWRILPLDYAVTSIGDEVVELQKQSLTNYILIIFKSAFVWMSGIYPEWFYSEDGK